jgi:hypothetical protein
MSGYPLFLLVFGAVATLFSAPMAVAGSFPLSPKDQLIVDDFLNLKANSLGGVRAARKWFSI